MEVITRMLCTYLLLLLAMFSSYAQKHFHLTVKLPAGMRAERVEAWLHDIKTVEKIKAELREGNQLVFTGDYYSIYAAVNLQYEPETPVAAFPTTFFIQEKPAFIKIYPSNSEQFPFKNYSMENARDFMKEKRQLEEYYAGERRKTLDYEARHGAEVLGRDTAIRNPYMKLVQALRQKELQFILDHRNSYYSFYSFKEDIARYRVVSEDSLLNIFSDFPDKFKYSDEGNYLKEYLHGRQFVRNKGTAIDFTTTDINNRNIKLSDFKGEKYVLLHFWATWCTPCMRELPALKKINDQYNSKDLQIISIALPSPNYADYLTTIKKFQMNWINVYNDDALQNKYGSQPVPRLYLIDKKGEVIYESAEVENNDFQLLELNRVLEAQ